MSAYSIRFLAIALIAGILGFGESTGVFATMAKAVFLVFLVLFAVSLIRHREPTS